MRLGTFANLMAMGVLVVAGCSSGNSSTATTSSTTARPSTTPVTTTSTSPSKTAKTTTTPPPSSTASTYNPPGRDELEALYRRYYAVYQACLNNPAKCDRAALALTAPAVEAAVVKIVGQRLAAGERRRPGAHADYFAIEDIVPAADGKSGTVKACEFDGSIRYKAATGAVVDDRIASVEVVYTGQQLPAGWKVVGVEEVNRWVGVNRCGRPTS